MAKKDRQKERKKERKGLNKNKNAKMAAKGCRRCRPTRRSTQAWVVWPKKIYYARRWNDQAFCRCAIVWISFCVDDSALLSFVNGCVYCTLDNKAPGTEGVGQMCCMLKHFVTMFDTFETRLFTKSKVITFLNFLTRLNASCELYLSKSIGNWYFLKWDIDGHF